MPSMSREPLAELLPALQQLDALLEWHMALTEASQNRSEEGASTAVEAGTGSVITPVLAVKSPDFHTKQRFQYQNPAFSTLKLY